jgi:membrane dipeptidase
MDCCGHGHVAAPQSWVWSKPLVSVGAMLAGEVGPHGSTAAAQTAETTAAALAVLRNTISVDVHSHGGSTGITSKAPPSGDIANAMRAGSLAVACLADVPDWPVLGRSPEGALATVRTPAPGELYRYHLDRLAWMDRAGRRSWRARVGGRGWWPDCGPRQDPRRPAARHRRDPRDASSSPTP